MFEASTLSTFSDMVSPVPYAGYVVLNLSDASSQTPKSLSASTPRKRKLQNTARRLKRKLDSIAVSDESIAQKEPTVEDVLKFCDTHLNKVMAHFIKVQIITSLKLKNQPRYTTELKQFALALYFQSPAAYRFLRKSFHLPSKSTLYRITTNWPIEVGLNDYIFKTNHKKFLKK